MSGTLWIPNFLQHHTGFGHHPIDGFDMLLIDACIVWTPAGRGGGLSGKIRVTTVPTKERFAGFSHSLGASEAIWSEITDGERRMRLRQYVQHIVRVHGISVEIVRTALSEIEDVTPSDYELG